MLESVSKYCSEIPMKNKRLIVSIGAGRAETEINSNDICVCLDKNKKSLYSCAFACKHLKKTKIPIIFHQYNMKDGGLVKLLTSIKKVSNLSIQILFQHPSPSSDIKNKRILQSTIQECINAQRIYVVESIHFVYDSTPNARGTSWGRHELHNLVHDLCVKNETQHSMTAPSTISNKTDNYVLHPIFGKNIRKGWALMKKGNEMSFSVNFKLG
jgi:hypothetical protein